VYQGGGEYEAVKQHLRFLANAFRAMQDFIDLLAGDDDAFHRDGMSPLWRRKNWLSNHSRKTARLYRPDAECDSIVNLGLFSHMLGMRGRRSPGVRSQC
jgi:hypothetical protein